MAISKSNLPDAPVLKTLPILLDAAHYNNVFISLSRIGAPLKLVLPGMRGMEVRLDYDCWVCYDQNLSGQPMLAWTDFRSNARNGMYDAVPCRLLVYHPYAAILIRTLPEDINRLLLRRLARGHGAGLAEVLPFPRPGDL